MNLATFGSTSMDQGTTNLPEKVSELERNAPPSAGPSENQQVLVDEPNDSEAETEILSRRQTPRKPRHDMDASTGSPAFDPESRIRLEIASDPDPVAQLSSPKKRKADEERPSEEKRARLSSDEDEEDIVVRRSRAKRVRKTAKKKFDSEVCSPNLVGTVTLHLFARVTAIL